MGFDAIFSTLPDGPTYLMNMKFRVQIIIPVFACFVATTAFGWGDEGHRTIGAMADKLIAGTAAATHVHALLGDETLSTASVWADVVKGRKDQTPEMLQFKQDNPNHFVYHYTDIPFEEPRYRDDSVGATNVDVVHAIPACILILQGRAGGTNPFYECSLRGSPCGCWSITSKISINRCMCGTGYLDGTNFVDPNGYGKPFKDDQGANRLLFGGTNKLHFYWDVTVVQMNMANAHAQTPGQFAAALLSQPAPAWQDSGPLMSWDRDWANESLALSAKVHDVTVMDEDDSEKRFPNRRAAPPLGHQ